MGVAAVLACVSLIADMVAKLPIELLRKTTDGPKPITNHPGIQLMAGVPHELHTSFELRKLMMTGKLLGGNGYARVFREATGDPYAIQWIEPCRVSPRMVERPNGERIVLYHVDGQRDVSTRYDLIHTKGESRDGIQGVSPIRLLRESIGTAMTQTEAAGAMMKNGARWPGFMTVDGNPKPDDLKQIRDEVNANLMGAVNAGRIPVVGGAIKFSQLNGMSMVDAEFIESRRFELQEIARHYRIPPFLIGDSTASTTWGTGIEQQTLGFLNFCLDPHLIAFEQALNYTLLTTAEQKKGYYFRFDRDELASVSRMDTANYFNTMRNIGVYSVNDIRRKLDEPIISAADGGDNYALPLNSSAKAAPEPSPQPQPEPDPA
jgi:HK97 family phage portal protein